MSDPVKRIILTDNLFAYINSHIKENIANVYVAVGSGEAAWNSQEPPAPSSRISHLVSERARKKAVSIDYLVPGTKDISDVPTKKLLIKSPFFSAEDYEGEASAEVNECGIFINADDTPGSGILIAYSRFRTSTITRQIKISENFYVDFQ